MLRLNDKVTSRQCTKKKKKKNRDNRDNDVKYKYCRPTFDSKKQIKRYFIFL